MWVWQGNNNNVSDSNNLCIGSGSGGSLGVFSVGGSSDRNTMVGYRAGELTNQGRSNAYFGFGAGSANVQAANQTFVGSVAGANSIAGENTAVGNLACAIQGNSSAAGNTAIGYRALQGPGGGADPNNATSAYNVAVGLDAGLAAVTANYNTMVGTLAGTAITSGDGNTLIGSGSGKSNNNQELIIQLLVHTQEQQHLHLLQLYQTDQEIFKLWATSSRVSLSGSLSVGAIATSTTVGRIDASNDIVAFSSSDIRFKENIQPIENALQKVNQISGNTFDWKSDPELTILHGFKGKDIGVIAQEIEAILPEIVTTRDSGYKGVKYEKLVPLLIEAIKELNDKVNNLEETNLNLENNLKYLQHLKHHQHLKLQQQLILYRHLDNQQLFQNC